jgi:hypothetical protein
MNVPFAGVSTHLSINPREELLQMTTSDHPASVRILAPSWVTCRGSRGL